MLEKPKRTDRSIADAKLTAYRERNQRLNDAYNNQPPPLRHRLRRTRSGPVMPASMLTPRRKSGWPKPGRPRRRER